ncbi:MAG: hypothetical protein ACRDGA_04465 [Bacteroidota bacterium]
MSGSYSFLLHLVGFGLVSAVLTSNIVLEHKLRRETDWSKKMYIGGIMRTFGMFGPFVVTLLLLTGIGNIHVRYMDAPEAWYTEGWLVAKLILFAILATNGLFFGPALSKKRMMIIKAFSENAAPPDAENTLKGLNNQVSLFLLVQFLLLFGVLFLSSFGGAKHPGVF